MTVEHESIGVVIVEEQDKLKILRIVGKVVGNLALQGLITLDASSCMDFFQKDVAISKIQDTIQCSYIITLQALLTERFRFLSKKLLQPALRLEVQLTGQLRPDTLCPHLTKDDDVAADGLQTLAQTLQETVWLSQSVIDAEGIHTHASKFLGFVDHKTDHFRVRQIKLGQIAEA